MPNLPSWLSNFIITNNENPHSQSPPLESGGGILNDSNSLYNSEAAIPDDAPQLIKDMARNVADILTNIQKIRGERQSLITTALLTIAQNGYEVEKLGCAFIPLDATNSPGNPHTMLHVYHSAIADALHKLVELLESDGEFNGLGEDMDMLSKRIWSDYHSKMPENGG